MQMSEMKNLCVRQRSFAVVVTLLFSIWAWCVQLCDQRLLIGISHVHLLKCEFLW